MVNVGALGLRLRGDGIFEFPDDFSVVDFGVVVTAGAGADVVAVVGRETLRRTTFHSSDKSDRPFTLLANDL